MNEGMIHAARKADLYQYLACNHPSAITYEGNYLHLKACDSVYVRRGSCGYCRYSDGDTGNSIDFLVKYLGYSFVDAVVSLNKGRYDSYETSEKVSCETLSSKNCFNLPEHAPYPYKRAFSYLTVSRGLSPMVVNQLIRKGLLYQDVHGNAVFINKDKTYCEVRGTLSDVKYHRSYRAENGIPYWSFGARKGAINKVFICEGCIDAVSLYELQRVQHVILEPTIYCSIGGDSRQRAIDCIKRLRNACVILAVDNDEAGQRCRDANREIQSLIPEGKDWNDDLRRNHL